MNVGASASGCLWVTPVVQQPLHSTPQYQLGTALMIHADLFPDAQGGVYFRIAGVVQR